MIQGDGAFLVGAGSADVAALAKDEAAMIISARLAGAVAHRPIEIGERAIEVAETAPGEAAIEIGGGGSRRERDRPVECRRRAFEIALPGVREPFGQWRRRPTPDARSGRIDRPS